MSTGSSRSSSCSHRLTKATWSPLGALCSARWLQPGADIHALAAYLKGGRGLSEEDKQQIRAQIADEIADVLRAGVRDGEARAHGPGDFHNVDGSIDWRDVALFVEREQRRLPPRTLQKSTDFVADMATRARSPHRREPTQRQHEWLHDLFFKLGGKIT